MCRTAAAVSRTSLFELIASGASMRRHIAISCKLVKLAAAAAVAATATEVSHAFPTLHTRFRTTREECFHQQHTRAACALMMSGCSACVFVRQRGACAVNLSCLFQLLLQLARDSNDKSHRVCASMLTIEWRGIETR